MASSSPQDRLKAQGNDAFNNKRYQEAITFYSRAIDCDPNIEACGAIYSNRALCFQKLGQHQKALRNAEDCIRVHSGWWKGYSRKAIALRSLGKIDEARAAIEAVLRLDPNNVDAKKIRDELPSSSAINSSTSSRMFDGQVDSDWPVDRRWLELHGCLRAKKIPQFITRFQAVSHETDTVKKFLQFSLSPPNSSLLSTACESDSPEVIRLLIQSASGIGTDFLKEQLSTAKDEVMCSQGVVKNIPGLIPFASLCCRLHKHGQRQTESAARKAIESVKFFVDAIFNTGDQDFVRAQHCFELAPFEYAPGKRLVRNHFNTPLVNFALKHIAVDARFIASLPEIFHRIGGNDFVRERLQEISADTNETFLHEVLKCGDMGRLMFFDALRKFCGEAFVNEIDAVDSSKRPESGMLEDNLTIEGKTVVQDLLKTQGDKLFKQRQYNEAIFHYSEAIELFPDAACTGAIYSNRSACHQELGHFEEALKDAEACIRLRLVWWKGYCRKGTALHSLGKADDAIKAFEAASNLEPNNQEIGKILGELKERSQLDREATARDKIGAEEFDDRRELFEHAASNEIEIQKFLQQKRLHAAELEFRQNISDEERREVETFLEIARSTINTLRVKEFVSEEESQRCNLDHEQTSSFQVIKHKIKEATRQRKESARQLPRIEKSALQLDHNSSIGSGTTCSVYACSYFKTECAAKIYHSHITENKALQREMRAATHLKHLNIVTVLAIIVSDTDNDEIVGLLMERMKGTLRQRINLTKPFTDSPSPTLLQLLSWCSQTAAAISCAHFFNCIHCDIKPENVMLDRHQIAKLSDFGSAHVMSTLPTNITNVRGTALFIAPEYAGGDVDGPSVETDVFSFGMFMWVVLHPEDHGMGKTESQILRSLDRGKRPTISNTDVPAEIVALIKKCWHQDPAERPIMARVAAVLNRVVAQMEDTAVRTRATNSNSSESIEDDIQRLKLHRKIINLQNMKALLINQLDSKEDQRKWFDTMNRSEVDDDQVALEELHQMIDDLQNDNLKLTQITDMQKAAQSGSDNDNDNPVASQASQSSPSTANLINNNNNSSSNGTSTTSSSVNVENVATQPASGHQDQTAVSVTPDLAGTTNQKTGGTSTTSSEMRGVQNDDDPF